jgi:hypothetical protein
MCTKEGQKYRIARPLLHLDKTSPLISKHHTNWRLHAIYNQDAEKEDRIHYSSVFTVSQKDYLKVREILSNALSESLEVIKASPEEEPAVICMDLFMI